MNLFLQTHSELYTKYQPKRFYLDDISKVTSTSASPKNFKKTQYSQLICGSVSPRDIGSPVSKSKMMKSADLLDEIDDFHDKNQISKAIYAATTLKERIYIIDTVLRRRKEANEIDYERKLVKAAPTINQFVNNFHKIKIRKSNLNPNSFRFNNQIPSIDLSNNQVPGGATTSSARVCSTTNRFNPGQPSSKNQIQGGWFEGIEIDEVKTEDTIRGQEKIGLGLREETISNTLNELQNFSKPCVDDPDKAAKLNRMLKKKTFEYGENGCSLAQSDSNFNSLQSKENKNSKKRQTDVRMQTAAISSAKAKFEKELYKYLIKHENEQEYKNIILNTGKPKESIIRTAEAKVKTKFEAFTSQKKPNRSPIGNLTSLSPQNILHKESGRFTPSAENNSKILDSKTRITFSYSKSTHLDSILSPTSPSSPKKAVLLKKSNTEKLPPKKNSKLELNFDKGPSEQERLPQKVVQNFQMDIQFQ